ncbi:MAG TPA: PAS domain S-box protein, partial [Kofleriaceae bacterium]|nr:PAS domain S-box protein [Kofleriaceae bacterium]
MSAPRLLRRDPDAQIGADALLRLEKALSIPSIGVLSFKLDGEILDANPALERMSGFTAAELRARHWATLTPPEFMDVTRRAAHELATRGETEPYEKQWFRPDGSRWWGLFAPTRLHSEGPHAECLEFIIDITERKRAEHALRESEARARHAEE